MSSLLLAAHPEKTFIQVATQTLTRLWKAVHGGPCPAEVRSLLSTMMATWGQTPVPEAPQWPSDIGSDHSPFEFSVVLTPDAPELRIVVEAQGVGPEFAASRDACLRLNESLARRGADLRRFNQVRDLFLPDVSHARFALWHAVTLMPGPLRVKAYLNPQICGAHRAPALVKSALERLDMGAAWSTIASAMRPRPLRGEEIKYFALDLQQSAKARLKVYLYINDVTAGALERFCALRPRYVTGEVTEFCDAIAGSVGPYGLRPPCVYLAFTGNDATPSDVTVQIPIDHYAHSDRIARERMSAYLRLRALDPDIYERALSAVATRPLTAGHGLQTYVSLRTGRTPARVTVYFGAELYSLGRTTRQSSHSRLRNRDVAPSDNHATIRSRRR